MRTTTLWRLAAIVGVVGVALTGACGDDDEGPASPPPPGGDAGTDLTVIAEDIDFPEKSFTAEAGTVNVSYENEGNIRHTLLIEGVSGFRLEVSKRGDVDDGSVDLDAGNYAIFCDVAGHREAGMEGELDVS